MTPEARRLAADLAMVDRVVTLAGLDRFTPLSSACQHILIDPASELAGEGDTELTRYLLNLVTEAMLDPERLVEQRSALHELEVWCLTNLGVLPQTPEVY